MHPVLQNDKVLLLLFRYTHRSSNARCARVCRAWHEPALDALWHTVNIRRFSALLGWDHITHGAEVDDGALAIFNRYAARVRVLDCGVDPKHTREIASLFPEQPPFPRLTRIEIRPTWTEEDVLSITPFLTASVVSLTLPWAAGSQHLFDELGTRLSNVKLEHLEIASSTAHSTQGAEPDWMILLRQLPRLCCLSITIPSFSALNITQLAEVNAHQLRLHVDESTGATKTMPLSDKISSASSVTLWVEECSHMKEALLALASSKTTCYSITVETVNDVSIEGALEQLTATSPDMHTLSWTACRTEVLWKLYASGADYLTHYSLKLLARCEQMTHLHLEVQLPVYLNDQEVLDLFASWPKLQTCHLSPTRALEPQRHPALTVLPDIAALCPDLRRLELCVRSVHTSTEHEEQLAGFRVLQYLRLYFVNKIEDMQRCAIYIATLVPLFCDAGAGFATYKKQVPAHSQTKNTRAKRAAHRLTTMVKTVMRVLEEAEHEESAERLG